MFVLQTLTLGDLKGLTNLLDLRKAIDLVFGLLELSKNLLRHITYGGEVAHGKSFDGKLFGEALGDKAITQVVVVYSTLRLDSIEATVVVGEDQSLAGDSDPSTATTEDNDRVSDAGFVQAIQGVNGKAETQFLHLSEVLSRELIK